MKRPEASEEVGLAKRSVRVHRHLASKDELVETPRRDLGQHGADPVQEVLVGSSRREPELVWRRGRFSCSPSRDDLWQAAQQLADTVWRPDDHDRRLVVGRCDHRHLGDEQLTFGAAVETECGERDGYRLGVPVVTGLRRDPDRSAICNRRDRP